MYKKSISLVISFLFFGGVVFAANAQKGQMKVGFAERDITPIKGMERPGTYTKMYNNGLVHDRCKVRATVFDDGKMRIVLVGVDALAVSRNLVLACRDEIKKQCGIASEAILIAASHTHSGGPTGMVQPGEFDGASSLVKHLAYEISSSADPEYLKTVREAIVAAVVEADKKRVDAKACVGSGREDAVAFNRRFRMKSGITYTHPGKGNPDIESIAGPIDPEVGVIGVWDMKNHFLGCVVNYACHGTTSPGGLTEGLSADWIYYLEKTIRNQMDKDAVVVFLNGACGDITQLNNMSMTSMNANEVGEKSGNLVGTSVGAEAMKVFVRAEPGDLSPLDARVEVLKIPRRKPSTARVEQATKIAHQEPNAESPEWVFAKEIVLLDAIIQREPIVDVEVQTIQIGPAVFVTNPAELFCQLGLDIKKNSPFPFTYVVEMANGCVGYVPTKEALGEHGGGYETRLTSYSNLEVKAGTKIVEASKKLISELKPGAVPEPPKEKSPVKPWGYGAVPPEQE